MVVVVAVITISTIPVPPFFANETPPPPPPSPGELPWPVKAPGIPDPGMLRTKNLHSSPQGPQALGLGWGWGLGVGGLGLGLGVGKRGCGGGGFLGMKKKQGLGIGDWTSGMIFPNPKPQPNPKNREALHLSPPLSPPFPPASLPLGFTPPKHRVSSITHPTFFLSRHHNPPSTSCAPCGGLVHARTPPSPPPRGARTFQVPNMYDGGMAWLGGVCKKRKRKKKQQQQ